MTEKTRTLPERHGKRWEDDETQYVLGRVKQGAWHAQIASEVKRTTGGIVSHLKCVAHEGIQGGKSIDEMATLTGLTIDQIDEFIKKRELVAQIREERKSNPPPPLEKPIRPFFLNRPEETLLDVAIEIRDLLRQLVNPPVVVPTINPERRNSVTIKL
jgi:hypothetical protein